MSSWQWRGGSGSSSVAKVMRTSVPQSEQRYWIFTLRISPAGGGSGSGVESDRNMPSPTRNTKSPTRMPAAAQMNVPNVMNSA